MSDIYRCELGRALVSVPGVLPAETFRLVASPARPDARLFVVHVAESIADLRTTLETKFGILDAARINATCIDVSSAVLGYETLCGVLLFARELLWPDIVAHELAHAAFRVCDRLGVRVDHWNYRAVDLRRATTTAPNEETYCEILETLTYQFWREANARGYA